MKTAQKIALRTRGAVKVGRKKSGSGTSNGRRADTASIAPASAPATSKPALQWRLVFGATIAAIGVWSYWPTLVSIVDTWIKQPDYSHGFLVIPLAVLFLWVRRATCPAVSADGTLVGLSLLSASLTMRILAGRYFMEFLDAWSILPWAAAIVAILFGLRTLWWSLPSVAFLFFMIPLPFSMEGQLSQPLQKIATKISCFAIQLLGQPAFSEGNIIVVGESRLEVAQACSGLRLFMGVSAIAFAYAVLVRRSWWERLLVLAATVPIAIIANAARIVGTGLLLQWTTGKEAQHMAHDVAGWAMIPLAALLFWLVLWYLDKLLPEEEVLDMAAVVRKANL
jgi:exosortase